MKLIHVRVREIQEVTHAIYVEDDFELYEEDSLDDYVNEISEQSSTPIEVHDVQVESVLSAEVIAIN